MIRVVSSLLIAAAALAAAEPIRLHPGNPHYFLFRGKPTVLITSGEHYGAVINLDFDYKRYLKTLAAERLNLTRTFAGSYRESLSPRNFARYGHIDCEGTHLVRRCDPLARGI